MKPEKVRVGRIVRGFGIKGEVKVFILTDFPQQRFQVGHALIWQKQDQVLDLTISSVRYHQQHALLSFEGYPDLTAVEPLAQGDLWVLTKDLPEDGTRYAYDYVGCEVVTSTGESKGKVIEVISAPAHPILRVKSEGKDILIPLVKAFVTDFDPQLQKITVNWMEGL